MNAIFNYLTFWTKFPKNSLDAQRAKLIIILLVLMMSMLMVFTAVDLFFLDLHLYGLANFIGALLAAALFFYFRKTRNLGLSSRLTVYVFTFIVTGSIMMQAPEFHIFIWMCTVPPVAFYLTGIKKGYLISLAFALVMGIFIYYKGFYLEGVPHLMNISIAYLGTMLFIANFEKSREHAFALLIRDIDKRKEAEKKIHRLNNELEQKVIQRTRQLQEMNDLLNEEILVRRNAEEVSNRARLAALEANRVKSEFLSRMSHKLRTPLNSILGFAQVMEMSKLDDRQMKNLKHIHNGGKELLNLVNDILEINTIDNLEVSVSSAKFSLNDLIKTAVQAHGRKIMEKNLHVKIIEDPAGDIFIRSDRKLLERLVNYLLDNAVKFNRTDGEIKIQVTDVSGMECRENCFQVSVFDTGIGIREEDQAKIFDMFLTGDTGSYDAENVGLGLTMAKKIVEKLEGTIGVESRNGEGSHFWFRVPIALTQEAPPKNVNGEAAAPLAHGELPAGHPTLLVPTPEKM